MHAGITILNYCKLAVENSIFVRPLWKPDLSYTRKNLTPCSTSANKPSTNCIRTFCPKLSTSLKQAVNNL